MSTWIWDAFHRQTPNQLLLLRRIVTCDDALVAGELHVAARGSFRVWVDGAFVAHHDVQSSSPGDDAVRVDLAPALTGRRQVEVVVGVHLLGIATHHEPRALGGLWAEGRLTDASGATHPIDTDTVWQTAVPPGWRQGTQQAAWSTGFTEWSDRTLDDEHLGWAGAVPYPDDQCPQPYDRPVQEHSVDLEPHLQHVGHVPTAAWAGLALDTPDRAAALVAAGRIRLPGPPTDGAAGFVQYRLPHQLVGFLTLTVEAPATTVLDVVMGEATDAFGWPTATRQGIAAVDTVVVPAGRTVHRFWHRRSFRELAVVVRSAAVTVTAEFASVTADRPNPVFVADDDRYSRMHAVSTATVRVGRQDLYEDCPLREGGHYVADARLQALFDLTTTGVADTSRRSLRQFAGTQDPDGMIPALSPSGTHHRIPDFSLQWVCHLDEHVRLTGDDALLAELELALDRTTAWADGRWRNGRFDADEPGWWAFIDWWDFTAEARSAAMDAQYAAALRSACALADRAGRPQRAAQHRARLDEALRSLTGRLHHPHAAAILACALDTADARRLVDTTVFEGFVPETGYFAFALCRALVALGAPTAARHRLDEHWGRMLDAGAGTWWERWSPDAGDDDQSLCHPWSAGPVLLLPMLACGVDPLARSEGDARFAPVLHGVHAALHTPWGVVTT